jgi:hypothetical protein
MYYLVYFLYLFDYITTSRTSKSSTFKTLSSSKQESKASDPWPYWSYVLSLSSSHTGLNALILLPKPYNFRNWVHTSLVMLNHALMCVIQVFHSLWCWIWLVLVREMWSPIRWDVIWSCEDWCCGLSHAKMVEMVNTIIAYGAQIC